MRYLVLLKRCSLFSNIYFLNIDIFICKKRPLTCVTLDQVVCGRRPCLLPGTPGRDHHACPAGRECLEHGFLTCLSPPCHHWGFCSSSDTPPALHTKCEPNTGYLDNSCARITLIFNRDKLPAVSLELVSSFQKKMSATCLNLTANSQTVVKYWFLS